MPDSCSDRDELRHVPTPFVAADIEADTHDPVRPKLVGLLFHPGHREMTRAVHGLREDVQLAARRRTCDLKADVEDRASDNQPDRIETRLGDEQELVDAEVGGVQTSRDSAPARSRPESGTPSSDPGRIRSSAPHLHRCFHRVIAASRRAADCGACGMHRDDPALALDVASTRDPVWDAEPASLPPRRSLDASEDATGACRGARNAENSTPTAPLHACRQAGRAASF